MNKDTAQVTSRFTGVYAFSAVIAAQRYIKFVFAKAFCSLWRRLS